MITFEPVIYDKTEVYHAFNDLLLYYLETPETPNTAAAKKALIYILEDYYYEKDHLQTN